MTATTESKARPRREGRPQYTGLATYQDPLGRFELKHATSWIEDRLTDDRDGVIFLFEEGEPDNYFAVWVTELPEHVVAEDLDILREGLDDGLSQLPDLHVELARDDTLDNLVKLERIYTFTKGGETRKRRTWTLFVDKWRFVLIFQGATLEEFAYWTPMGNYAFARFELPQELWFATDRDLSPYARAEEGPEDGEEASATGS